MKNAENFLKKMIALKDSLKELETENKNEEDWKSNFEVILEVNIMLVKSFMKSNASQSKTDRGE